MKKHILSALLITGLAVSISAPAFAEANIAVVDINVLVNKSAQVQALKKENEAKAKDLQKWLKIAQEDIQKQQSKEGKEKLAKKYDAELKKKQEANKKEYADKLNAIDKSITATIVNEAKAKGYDLVLSKQGAVLYGGRDITADLTKVVK